MSAVIPKKEDEGETVPTSIRIPKKLLDRIDKAAQQTGNTRNEAILWILRWGVTEHEKDNGHRDAGPRHEARAAQ